MKEKTKCELCGEIIQGHINKLDDIVCCDDCFVVGKDDY